MKPQPEPDTDTKPSLDEDKKRYDEFTKIPIKGSAELRKKLGWSNDSYHATHPAHASDAKGYYLYGVLNEVEKAGLSAMQAFEFVRDSKAQGVGSVEDEDGQRIADNILQSRIDELALWQRKLTELIVEIQGFSRANKEDYYKHYLAVHELKSLRRTQGDLKEFYGVENKNYALQEQDLTNKIDALAPKLDPAKCWYVELGKTGKITKRLEGNFEARFQRNFKIMRPELRATLRTLHLSFGTQSKSVHVTTSASGHMLDLDSIDAHAGRVINLSLHVIVMIKDLMYIQNTKGWLKTCADLVKKNEYPVKLHAQRTRPDIEVGDFVVVAGSLAQVIKSKISKDYRYKAFTVRYLKGPQMANIAEDEFPADMVRLLYKRGPLLAQTVTAIKNLDPKSDPSSRKISRMLKEGVIEGWDNGLREHVLNGPEAAKPKFEEYKRLMKKRYDTVAALAKLHRSRKPKDK